MNYFVIKIFLVLFTSKMICSQNDTNLVQVLIMYGNVPRVPDFVYPNDTIDWTQYGKLGQITEKGLFSSYNFGQFIKNYYSDFLTASYDSNKVYARSTDNDCSIMSLNTFTAGMYPPSKKNFIWSSSVSWYPIPVHTNNHDQLFYEPCTRLALIIKSILNSNEYKLVETENLNLTQSIQKQTGLVNLTYFQLKKILESNLAKLANNLPVEEWVWEKWEKLTSANDYHINITYGTEEKAKLIAGSLLNSIKNEMMNKITKSSPNEINIYSSLESHLSGMKQLLIHSLEQPAFLSAIIFELRKNLNGSYFVKLLLKNNSLNSSIKLEPVKIKGCDLLCPWSNFVDLINNKIVNNLSEACGTHTAAIKTTDLDSEITTADSLASTSILTSFDLGLIISTALLALICVVLLFMLFIGCFRIKKGFLTRV